MADPRYGAGGGNIDDTLARMNAESNASDLRAKAASLEERATGRSTGALTENVGARDRLVTTTNRLQEALRGSLGALEAETRALQANTQAWERRGIAQSRGGVATAERAAGGGAAASAFIGPVESPQMAQARYQDALRAQAAAELQAVEARRAVASAQRTAATTPEQLTPLIAQREAANQAVVNARAQSKAAQDNVRAQEQAAQQQQAAVQAQRGQQAELQAALQERVRAEQAAAEAAATAAAEERRGASLRQRSVVSGAGILAAGADGPQRLQLGPGSSVVTGGPASLVSDAPLARQFIASPIGGAGAVGLRPQPFDRAAATGFSPLENVTNQNALNLERLAGSQERVNGMMHESVASYAASSQALQRHGALTAEFVQAFARGEVTLQEFQSQMLTTMGKFGGWAVAGAAVFGVVDALRQLYEGAKEAQTGYVQLTRFIPGVQQGPATQTITDISSQLNVPVKDVVDTITIMARTFKTLPEAAEATRAALLASRLDQIAPTQSAPYLVGISQAFGLDAHGTMGVVNSLNALQREYGARVAETLPGLAKAAPAALAAGVDQHTLEALIGVGVRAGFSGSQVATAVARSATTFVQKPQDQALLERYGFNPNQPYGDLIKQISAYVGAHDRAGSQVPGKELRDLAIGLAGPQLGARTMAAILARGGLINEFTQTAAHPGETAAQERQKQLGSITEQVHAIGIGLQDFGASLASSGILLPLQALLQVLHLVGQAADLLVSPLASIGTAIGQLPGPLKEILGALALGAGAQVAYRSTFGRTAAGALSQVPGLSFLNSPNAQAVRQLQATQNAGFQLAQNEQERLSGVYARATPAAARAAAATAGFVRPQAEVAALSQEEQVVYQRELARLIQEQDRLTEQAIAAETAYLSALDNTRDAQARIAFLTTKQLSDAEKVAGASAMGLRAAQIGSPNTLPVLLPRTAEREELARNASQTVDSRTQTLIAQARGRGGVSIAGALGSVDDEVIAQQALQNAEKESPGFIAGRFSSLSAKLGAGGGMASVLGAAGLAGIGSSRAVSLADRGLTGAQGLSSALVGGIPGAIGSAFTGILAGQLANAIIPGAAGNFIGSTITGGSLGLGGASLLNSVLERYGATGIGSGAAFALGAGASALGSGNPITSTLGGGAVGFGLGSVLTKVLGAIGPEGAVAPELALPLAIGGSAFAALNALGSNQTQLTAGQIAAGRPAPPPSWFGVKGASDFFGATGQAFGSVLSGGLFSYDNDPTAGYQRQMRRWRAQQAQISSLTSQNLSDNSIASFGDIFGQQIQDAFNKTGQDAKTALTSVNHQVSVLAANVTSFGLGSREGKHSAALLQEAAGQTVAAAGRDPQNIDQYIQVAEKADQSLQQARDQSYQLADARAKTGQERVAALNALIAAEQHAVDAEYTSKIPPLQKSLTSLSSRYNQLLDERAVAQQFGEHTQAHRLTGQLNTVGGQISQTQGAVQALRDRAAQVSGQNYLKNAQQQVQVYSAVQTDIQSQTALQVARDGADKLAALRAQAAGDRRELENASRNLTLNPEKRTNEIETIRAKLATANQAVAQEVEARAESLQKLQEAEVPLNLPLAAINKVIADAQANLARMQANPAAFSQQQIQQQQLAIVQAQRTRAQQGLTNVQAQADLAKSSVPSYDPVAVAQADLSGAEAAASYVQAHAKDFNFADILKALATVNSARQAVADAIHQNQLQLVAAQGGIAKAADYGNVVAQAQDDISTAARQLSLARTPLERAQATQQLMDAQNNYNQAVLQHIKNETDLAASLVIDPVQKARIQLQGAQRELAAAKGIDNRLTAQANVNNLKQAYEQSLIQQRQSTTEFQLNMQQITVQQAINQLQDLLKLRGITLQDRQSILQRIRQLQLTDNTGGQFDLAPGNIKLPTPYDVRRAVQRAVGARVAAATEAAQQGSTAGVRGGSVPRGHDVQAIIRTGGATIGAVDARTYVTIHVEKNADVMKVADALERATGTRISARARARGIG